MNQATKAQLRAERQAHEREIEARFRRTHPWATCSPAVAVILAELEATYGCQCEERRP